MEIITTFRKTLFIVFAVSVIASCKKSDPPSASMSGVGEIAAGIGGEIVVYGSATGGDAAAFGIVYENAVTLTPESTIPAHTFMSSHINVINGSQGMLAQLLVHVPEVTGSGEYDIVALGGEVQLLDTRAGRQDGYVYGIGEHFPGSSGKLYIDELGPRVTDSGRIAKGSVLGIATGRKVSLSDADFDREVSLEVIFNQDLSF